jgi:hypothetical protein
MTVSGLSLSLPVSILLQWRSDLEAIVPARVASDVVAMILKLR